MNRLILSIMIALSATSLFAQNVDDSVPTRPLNSLNINLLGDASLISLNYERLFLIDSTFLLAVKLGLGYNEEFCFFLCESQQKSLTIPHSITGNIGRGRHFFEFGLGGTFFTRNPNHSHLLYPIVGYRLHSLNSKRLVLRLFSQAWFVRRESGDFIVGPIGMSVGLTL